jgi:hypothetical protein
VLCRPTPAPVVKQPTKIEKLKATIVTTLRAHGSRLGASALRRLLNLKESRALETEDGEITRPAAWRFHQAIAELRRAGIIGQEGGRLRGYGMPVEALWLIGLE